MNSRNRSLFVRCLSVLPLLGGWVRAQETPAFTPEQLEFFEKRIRPVLVEKCHRCHSAGAEKLKGGLYLDSRDGVLLGGELGAAVDPDHPGQSLLLESLHYGNPDLQMPPKGKLDAAVIADIEKWVADGLPWPTEAGPGGAKQEKDFAVELQKRRSEQWSWQPIKNPAPPAVKATAWPENDIDRFILAKLEANGLLPAEDTAPESWLRRAHFDLTGLPPSPQEVEAFLADAKADPAAARRAVADRLLASPHFGERWARHWMDLARFAETCGHEFDYPIPEAWRYRDYLIRACNEDLPYDRFLTEHLAGDLLPDPRRPLGPGTNDSLLATGFWFLHEAVHAPTDVRQDEADRIDNQLDVFGKTFLGLGLGCARCHDHKFDPISAADYYALYGYLQSVRRQEAPLDPGGTVAAAAAKAQAILAQGDALLPGAFGPQAADSGRQFASYLLAAREVLTQPAPAASPAGDQEDIVFADFEDGYGGWQAEGKAFGKQPAEGAFPRQQTVSGYLGKRLVNSYNGNDNLLGRLRSPEFTISRRHLTFLIGGGNYTGETCLNLLVDNHAVFTATGQNAEALAPVSWDVSAYLGKKAVLEVVDQRKGGWGHVNVDHVVFTDHPGTASLQGPPKPDPALIRSVAAARGLPPEALASWVETLQDPAWAKDPGSVWHAWVKTADDAADRGRMAQQLAQRQQQHEEARAGMTRLASFEKGKPEGWTSTGEAFAQGPLVTTEWAGGTSGGLLAPGGTWSGGRNGSKFQGMLYSPTFELTAPFLHLRLRARNVEVRLVIDGHYMNHFSQLLLGGTLIKKDRTDTQGKSTWLTMSGNLDKYIGHRVWIEISDLGEGEVTLDEVLMSGSALPPEGGGAFTRRVLAASPGGGTEALAEAYGKLWGQACAGLADGKVDEGGCELLNAVWQAGLWPEASPALQALAKDAAALDASVPAPQYATALLEGNAENEPIHLRGSIKKTGETVPRRNLTALGAETAPAERSGRLELARSLTAPDNPLVARVLVNRLWHHLFGRGLVPTVDDFGAMGLPPSHPELLDWLAWRFRERGWSVKTALREMVLSRTYRMSTVPNAGNDPARLAEVDPDNLLRHRASVRRLEGEVIRDAMLSISGRLKPDIGGPSVPVNLSDFMDGRGRPGRSGPVDGDGRRSLYTEVRRNFLPPFLLAFDTPIPFNAMGRRAVSNVPAQSLVLMNDPLVQDLARSWAARSASQHPDQPEARLRALFLEAFGRPARDEEVARARSFLAASGGDQTATAWEDLCHALLNKKEFIFLN